MSNDNPLEDLSQDKPDVNLQKPSPYAQQPSPPYQQQPPSTHQPQPNQAMYNSGYAPPAYVIPVQQKSLLLAYVFWFFLAGFGAHKFYLGKIKTGIAWIAVSFIIPFSVFLVMMTVAAISGSEQTAYNAGVSAGMFYLFWAIGIFVWWIVDACLMPSQTVKANEDLRIKYSNRVV